MNRIGSSNIACAQLVAELREALAIDRVVLVEAPEVEPVAAELRGQPARALVFQHAAHLREQHRFVAQIAGGGARRQLGVRHARPQEVAQPARERVIGQRRDARARRVRRAASADAAD